MQNVGGIEQNPYIQNKLLKLKWSELGLEFDLKRDVDGCVLSKQVNTWSGNQYGGGQDGDPQKPIEFSLN